MSEEIVMLLRMVAPILGSASPQDRLEFFQRVDAPYCGECGNYRDLCTCDDKNPHIH